MLIPSNAPENPRKIPVTCDIALKNCGNTPASAIDWDFELRIGESTLAPPSIEIYDRKFPDDRQTLVPIGQDRLGNATAILKPHGYISVVERAAINGGNSFLRACNAARH
jgi:hypothetical protein